jgi:hypothetical protein
MAAACEVALTAFNRPDHVLMLELDRSAGAPFDDVVVEVDGADDLARRIAERAGASAAGTG